MIPDSFIQDLLARVDIADVVGRYVQLKKGGINLLGLCPFHNEKSPSFTVSPTKQFYHCFGCGVHGSAISFLIEHTGASFPEAVTSLASSVGMVVPAETRTSNQRAQTTRKREERSQHTQVLEAAQLHYLQQLRNSPEAIAYLKKRGLTGDIAKAFGLGWSGADRQALLKVFPNYSDPLLVESGLVIQSEDGRRYDRFRERVMFPIRNAKGELIGFGGRIIGKGEPKYLNSPETPIFSKGQELYGLFEARTAIRKEAFVIVVEGYMDVVGLAQLGVGNAVATLGTATTSMHIQKLLRVSDRIVFSFDGDKAGRKAAWRALETCLPLLRDDISIRFLFLPAEHDPDSYIREFGTEAFKACLVESDALSTFFLNELSARHQIKEVEGRSSLIHEAKSLLAAIPDSALKVQLHNELARLVQFTPEELSQALRLVPAANTLPFVRGQASLSADVRLGEVLSGDEQLATAFRTPTTAAPGFDAQDPRWADFERDGGHAVGNSYHDSSSGRRSLRNQSYRSQFGSSRRSVTPMASRLLGLLLTHPDLVAQMGDQQLEVLDQAENLEMVKEVIVLVQRTRAKHVGALIEAAEPGSDLAGLLISVGAELMAQEELPNPQAEWEDALLKIEIDNLKREQNELINQSDNNFQISEKYRELSRRLSRLINVVNANRSK